MRGQGSLRSFLKTLETYFVNSIEGEWGSAPFPARSDGTYLLFCDLITVFLNVIKLMLVQPVPRHHTSAPSSFYCKRTLFLSWDVSP